MGRFAKLVNTEDVHIRYVPYGDLALLQCEHLVLPIVAIVEGGVRIPMHTFFIRFLTHFRLSPLQCVPNVFRIVMGTIVLNEKFGLNLTVHDITYVYSLQKTGKDQYTLVARNFDRKLVTGLPDSSKGRDEDFLVITGNWQNPHVNCPLTPGVPGFGCFIYLLRIAFLILFPLHWLSFFLFFFFFFFFFFFLDKKFTGKKIEFVETKMVEHLLKKPCFIDSGGRPCAASILLEYEPSYNSFLKGPTVKHFRQEEITVVHPGKDQEEIIQAVPVTARRGVQVPQLVPPLTDPNFVPSLESSKVGDPVIRFPSLFNLTHRTEEEMPVQKRSIDIGTVLGTSVP
jgi:hypothetical protein